MQKTLAALAVGILSLIGTAACSGSAFSVSADGAGATAGGTNVGGAGPGISGAPSHAGAGGASSILPSSPAAGSAGSGGTDSQTALGGSSQGGDASSVEPEAGAPPWNPTLELTEVEDSELRGYVDENSLTVRSTCPVGSVLVGVHAQLAQNVIGQLQGICGIPRFAPAASQLTIAPGKTLDLQGDAVGEQVTARCPPDQVVVGFDGRYGILLDRLRLYCSPVLIADRALAVADGVPIEPIGGDGGGPFPTAECAPGAVASGVTVALDSWPTAFGTSCSYLVLRPQEEAP